MSYKMIVLDLDGTLLDPSSQVPEENKEALMRFQERGGIVTLATGKLFKSMAEICRTLDLSTPQIVGNGGALVSPKGELIECTGYLTPKQIGEARSVWEKVGLPYLFYGTGDIWYERGRVERPDIEKLTSLGEQEPEALSSGEIDRLDKVIKLLAFCDDQGQKDREDQARELAKGDPAVRLFRSSFQFIEISRTEVNKGLGLKRLTELLRVDLAEVVAVGDGENDLEMFEVAGLSVAMGQAEQSIKEAADVIAPSNAEYGVTRFMEEYKLI